MDFKLLGIQIIHYSEAQYLLLTRNLNSRLIVSNTDPHWNNRPFGNLATFDNYNTVLVYYSDPL